jgi:hypothetical protein
MDSRNEEEKEQVEEEELMKGDLDGALARATGKIGVEIFIINAVFYVPSRCRRSPAHLQNTHTHTHTHTHAHTQTHTHTHTHITLEF